MDKAQTQPVATQEVRVATAGVELEGSLAVPKDAQGVVLFAHGSGSSRHSPRNQYVARVLRQAGIGTLLIDLMTNEEESVDQYTRHLRFDIEMTWNLTIEDADLPRMQIVSDVLDLVAERTAEPCNA